MKLNRKPMQAVWITPFAQEWMLRSTAVRLLHSFAQVCNLVNEQGEIVSIVSEEIGCGPFAVVVPALRFAKQLRPDIPIRIGSDTIFFGEQPIHLAPAKLWHPTPNWHRLQAQTAVWQPRLSTIEQYVDQYLSLKASVSSDMQQALAAAQVELVQMIKKGDLETGSRAITKLAGLGNGLTPSGDDFLMGVLYGLHAIGNPDLANEWGGLVVKTAVPRTTTLSAAWLRCAARGEATAPWHELVRALTESMAEIETAVHNILAIGHTSGADALTGFLTITSNKEF